MIPLGGLLVLIASHLGPETKNADLLEGAEAQARPRQDARKPAAVDRRRVPTTVT